MKKFRKIGSTRSAAAVVAQMALMASARANDLFQIGNRSIDLAKLIVQALFVFSVVIGVMAMIHAGVLMRKKAGDRGEDISMGRILMSLIAGVALVVLAFVLASVYQTFGASAGDIGKNIF